MVSIVLVDTCWEYYVSREFGGLWLLKRSRSTSSATTDGTPRWSCPSSEITKFLSSSYQKGAAVDIRPSRTVDSRSKPENVVANARADEEQQARSVAATPHQFQLQLQLIAGAPSLMTRERCFEFCNGTRYAALEGGGQCWCGNTLGAATPAAYRL
jgi:hypothetical protein